MALDAASVALDRETVRELRRMFKEVGELVDPSGSVTTGNAVLKGMWREIADWLAAEARAEASTPLERKMAPAIKGSATVGRGARLQISKTKSREAAWAAFWGQTRRSGWFAAGRYREYSGRDQGFKRWVGASWGVGQQGEGPYALNPAIAKNRAELEKRMRAGFQRALDQIAGDSSRQGA